MENEAFIATAIDHNGNVLGKYRSCVIRQAMALVDARHPNCHAASVRGEYTSDGTHHGLGNGRVVASREPRTIDGAFYSGWLIG